MATKSSGASFADTDFYKIFDFTKFDADFSKFAGQFNLPNLDGGAVLKAQQKNLEVVTAANRVALEGMQALARRQAEIVRQAGEEFNKAAKELSGSKSLEDSLAKQTDLAKGAFEQALSNVRELTEMTVKSQAEAADLINARVAEQFDEFKTAIKQAAK